MAVVKYIAAILAILATGTIMIPMVIGSAFSVNVAAVVLSIFWAAWLIGAVAWPLVNRRKERVEDE